MSNVPENQKKKAVRDARMLGERQAAAALRKTTMVTRRKQYLANAEKYYNEYQQMDQALVTKFRDARKNGQLYVPAEPKVALVIRIKGIHQHSPKVKKVLQLFRLRQIHNATFVKLNKATVNMLQMIGYCCTWGFPNRKTIKELIYVKGFGKSNGQRLPLTTNEIVERELGQYGILCVEDVIHELVTCGEHFKQVNNFLWPFHLSSPRGGYGGSKGKRHSFINGGVWGQREKEINSLCKRMLPHH